MTLENQLINKNFFETYMVEKENLHPIRVLGEAYVAENQKESSDLTMIRFAQGEVYYHHKDYEAAIFKWENINNEFLPWARKNVADAYFELDLLSTAEDIYKSIETDSDVLKIEVLLQLFSLYIEKGKLEKAVESIKNAVYLDPDYPDVTNIARAFFEEHQDWQNAVELAVNESIRTESLSWFHTLKSYVLDGKTAKIEPAYFSEALTVLYKNDLRQFENLAAALWKSYQGRDLYFAWLKEFNQLMKKFGSDHTHTWNDLSALYHETYFDLINGKRLIRDLSHLIPLHLKNWVSITSPSYALVASASVLAWSEIFPSNIEAEAINEAEQIISQSGTLENGLEECFMLFQSIMKWAEEHDVLMGERFEWMVKELLDLNAQHVIIAGMSSSGKSEFVQELLGDSVRVENLSASVMYKDYDAVEMTEVTDESIRIINDFSEIRTGSDRREQIFVDYKMPFAYLAENQLAVIDTPGLSSSNKFRNDVFQYLHFADSLLFVLNANHPLSDRELDIVVKVREQAPSLPVHFLLNHLDVAGSEQEAVELMDDTISRVSTYFPKAKIFAYSPQYDRNEQLSDFSVFIKSMMEERHLESERTEKMLHYIRKSIKFLLDKRVEKENGLIDDINWNEEMLTKLNGAIHQLEDMEEDKIKSIKHSYRDIKKTMEDKLSASIPEILRNCAETIHEDSDFSKLHVQLNEEMNQRIRDHIEENVLPEFRLSIQDWIAASEQEFNESQAFLHEMGDSFNELYGFNKLTLSCDFRILEDWKRDADRLTHGGIQLEKANILLRYTPTQILLKSAGKIFGLIPQNKAMLHNKYKQFVENEDYREIADNITASFIQQFELFEKALDRDIKMFFQEPYAILNTTVEESHTIIANNNQALEDMRQNPEVYKNPLTLFELKLKQYVWMTNIDERVKQYN